ncbi:hypothetical protein FRX31_010563 [Thalictrum thalictroides]|uniref:Uncharacterized protein n=1 Tax=Thalictrum thalictroides TaxID=46969 RepID=A0A7J6WTQ2_THATH|nr:hypothetical protein FRX31_010563 [Thalictrum thalictroides]
MTIITSMKVNGPYLWILTCIEMVGRFTDPAAHEMESKIKHGSGCKCTRTEGWIWIPYGYRRAYVSPK